MKTFSTRADWLLRLFVTLLVLAYPAATLFINHGDSYTLGLLAIVGVWVWIRDGARIWLNRDSGMLCLVFALLFAAIVLSYLTGYQTVAGFHYLGRYLRFLFIVPVYLAFRRYPPTVKTLFIGLALGALVAGVLASLEFMQAHGPIRVDAQTDLSIIFGDLTTTMVLCMVAGFGLMADSRRRWSVPLLGLCLAGGVLATLLSGTRGAWLSLFLLIPALAAPAAGFLKRRYIFMILIVIVAVFSSSYLVTRTDTQGRINLAFSNTMDYFIGLHAAESKYGLKTRCNNQENFLNAWLNYYNNSNNRPSSDTAVVEDPLIKKVDLCSADYAVRLYNSNHKKWVGYTFPRVSQPNGKLQSTRMYVRGKGIFILSKAKDAHLQFDTLSYTQLSLQDPDWPGEILKVYVLPGETAWLVPIENYFGEYSLSIGNTSVGARFEMWRAAWQMFLSNPLLGVGTGAYQAKTNELIQKGKIAPFVSSYDHPHDDYLDALSSRGVVGLIMLMAILLIPIRRFLLATRNPERTTHAIGLAGVLTVAGFAIYALTDTIFIHSMMITWYVVYMALFYALLDTPTTAQQTICKPAE
jgi:O-antigen ligase